MKSYQQHCGLAKALDVVGERWTLLMIRELLLGPRRFKDFALKLDGMTTNLLASRLKHLCDEGLIEKLGRHYQLTQEGLALEPAIMALAEWGQKRMKCRDPKDRADAGWALLSLKRRYRGDLEAVAEIRVAERVFGLFFDKGTYRVVEGTPDSPDLLLSLGLEEFFRVFFGGQNGGDIQILGSKKLAADFKWAFKIDS